MDFGEIGRKWCYLKRELKTWEIKLKVEGIEQVYRNQMYRYRGLYVYIVVLRLKQSGVLGAGLLAK